MHFNITIILLLPLQALFHWGIRLVQRLQFIVLLGENNALQLIWCLSQTQISLKVRYFQHSIHECCVGRKRDSYLRLNGFILTNHRYQSSAKSCPLGNRNMLYLHNVHRPGRQQTYGPKRDWRAGQAQSIWRGWLGPCSPFFSLPGSIMASIWSSKNLLRHSLINIAITVHKLMLRHQSVEWIIQGHTETPYKSWKRLPCPSKASESGDHFILTRLKLSNLHNFRFVYSFHFAQKRIMCVCFFLFKLAGYEKHSWDVSSPLKWKKVSFSEMAEFKKWSKPKDFRSLLTELLCLDFMKSCLRCILTEKFCTFSLSFFFLLISLCTEKIS